MQWTKQTPTTFKLLFHFRFGSEGGFWPGKWEGYRICLGPWTPPSCCWWDGQALLRTLPDNTSNQKRSFWENGPKITKKIRHATLPPLAAQPQVERRFWLRFRWHPAISIRCDVKSLRFGHLSSRMVFLHPVNRTRSGPQVRMHYLCKT